MKKGGKRDRGSRIFKALAIILALVLIVGTVPASAASSKQVEVKTKKQFLAEIAKAGAETIVFSTQKEIKFTIPSSETSSNKKVIINAPNATITNKASLKGITLNETKAFTEKGSGNSITVKSNETTITVAKGSEVSKMTVAADKVDIKVLSNAVVGDIVCKLKSAEVTVDVAKKADVNITLSKKTNLTVTGNKAADVDIVSKAKNSTVTASVPVEVTAEKALKKINLKEGAEASNIVLGEGVKAEDITVSGKAKNEITVKDDKGETIVEPEKKEEKTEETKKDDTGKTEEKKEDSNKDNSGSSPSSSSGQTSGGTGAGTSSGGSTSGNGGTTSGSGSGSSGGGGTTDYSQTPNDKDLCTLAIDTSEAITTELYAGESKIVNESPLKKGTNLTLYFYVNDRTKNVVLYVNGQKKDYISFSWEPNQPRGYYSFNLLSDMTIRLICEDATWAFNTGTNGNTWLVLEETSEIINATGSSVTFNKNHFIKAKPDEGFVPRVKLGGRFVSLSLDTNTGEYSHWFTAYDTYVSEGKILIETEFVPKNTEYEVAFELATGGAFNIINVDENNKIIQNGEKVKAGSLIKVVAIPEGTNQLADVTLNWSEFANGPKAAWPVYVGDDGVIVNGDSRISVSFSRCKVTSRIIGDWSGGRTHLSGGKYSAGGGGVIDYGILVGKNSFAVTTELMPGYEVISFVINGEDHTEEMARNLSYDYVFKGDETEIYTETALGKIGNTYAKVVIEGNNELSRAYLYYYEGREYRSVDMGKKDYIPIGTEVNLTASAKNGYKVDSIKAGETILEAGEFGQWKYIVNADVTFSAVTSIVP